MRISDWSSDVCSSDLICTSADATNVGMISSAAIDAIGPDGLLVNVARGQLVDEDALIDALRRGRLGAAALDVFATEPTPPSRWEGVPNILCTPRSEEHTSELPSLMRISYAVFCLKKKTT